MATCECVYKAVSRHWRLLEDESINRAELVRSGIVAVSGFRDHDMHDSMICSHRLN